MSTGKMVKSESPYFKEGNNKNKYVIEYGTLKKGANSQVRVDFEGINFMTFNKSCSCTNPEISPKENGFTALISYNTNKIGTINQWVKFNTSLGEIKIDLKGQVV